MKHLKENYERFFGSIVNEAKGKKAKVASYNVFGSMRELSFNLGKVIDIIDKDPHYRKLSSNLGNFKSVVDKKLKSYQAPLKKVSMDTMLESINEEQYFNPKGEFKKYMDKVFKQAGIRVIKFDPMKESFFNGAWGGFYTVKSSNKIDIGGKPVTRGSAVLPVYISRVGEIQLGVSAKGFHLGRAGSSRVVKNLIDFRKEDLGESINETPYELGGMKIYSKADGLKKVKSMQKTGGAKIYKVTKTKTKLYGKHPVTMYNLHTKNKNHSTNQNPYGLDMMKGVYLIPIEEGTCGYGLDGNLGEEPAGPHLIKKKKKKVKENKQEKLQIAKTILSQLGGNKFVAMTGAKSFGYDSKGSVVSLQFRIGRNAKQVNIVRINYIRGKDLYEMNFYKGTKLLKKVSNVYADQLQKIFTKHTGMYTRL